MYPAVKEVIAQSNYNLLLTFENGEQRHLNMRPYLEKGLFRDLLDESVFRSVRISFDTVEWENEADLDPEFIYLNSTCVNC